MPIICFREKKLKIMEQCFIFIFVPDSKFTIYLNRYNFIRFVYIQLPLCMYLHVLKYQESSLYGNTILLDFVTLEMWSKFTQ